MNNYSKKINRMYEILFEHFGEQNWWPADSPWEVAVGAILTQNTNWSNVEQAVAKLKEDELLLPEKIADVAIEKLEAAIRSSGYFRQKAERLKIFAGWWLNNTKSSCPFEKDQNLLRKSLLGIKGIGPETADSMLLYAFEFPAFVIDTYTKRIAHRHLGIKENISYDELQNIFVGSIKKDIALYNNFHALLVMLGKDLSPKSGCKASCPLCLADLKS